MHPPLKPLKNLEFKQQFIDDIAYWKRTYPQFAKKIRKLIEDIERSPYSGLGKPEPLKHEYSGYWARRINQEHRLLYRVEDDTIVIVSCRFHYE